MTTSEEASLASPFVADPPEMDRLAFTDLLVHCDPSMRRLAGRLMRTPAAMDDALQDAYVKAFRKRSTFTGDDNAFERWLYRVVYNTCLDHLRSSSRRWRNTLPLSDLPTESAAHAAVGPPISVGEAVVNRAELLTALRSLSADHAAALTLICDQGYSYAEAAEILDVEPGTVASRVHRARAQLQASLAPASTTDPDQPANDKSSPSTDNPNEVAR